MLWRLAGYIPGEGRVDYTFAADTGFEPTIATTRTGPNFTNASTLMKHYDASIGCSDCAPSHVGRCRSHLILGSDTGWCLTRYDLAVWAHLKKFRTPKPGYKHSLTNHNYVSKVSFEIVGSNLLSRGHPVAQ